jgi:hypothetical protein
VCGDIHAKDHPSAHRCRDAMFPVARVRHSIAPTASETKAFRCGCAAGQAKTEHQATRRGRICRYYVARDAIADGYDTCPITTVPYTQPVPSSQNVLSCHLSAVPVARGAVEKVASAATGESVMSNTGHAAVPWRKARRPRL